MHIHGLLQHAGDRTVSCFVRTPLTLCLSETLNFYRDVIWISHIRYHVMRYIPEDSGQQTVCDILLSLILGKAKLSVYFNKVVVKSYKR